MTLAALKDVYNPLAIKKVPKHSLNNWTDSIPVILLSEYIKMQKHLGIKLYQDNGIPCVSFNPGSRSLPIIEAVTRLLEDAVDDLKELIANGALSLPDRHRGSFHGLPDHG
jgi:hypothetical protein